jgi:hypothetical protein
LPKEAGAEILDEQVEFPYLTFRLGSRRDAIPTYSLRSHSYLTPQAENEGCHNQISVNVTHVTTFEIGATSS